MELSDHEARRLLDGAAAFRDWRFAVRIRLLIVDTSTQIQFLPQHAGQPKMLEREYLLKLGLLHMYKFGHISNTFGQLSTA